MSRFNGGLCKLGDPWAVTARGEAACCVGTGGCGARWCAAAVVCAFAAPRSWDLLTTSTEGRRQGRFVGQVSGKAWSVPCSGADIEAADPCSVLDQAIADAAHVDDPVFACGAELAA
jgi:hypothetical protein